MVEPFKVWTNPPGFKVIGHGNSADYAGLTYKIAVTYIVIPEQKALGIDRHEVGIEKNSYDYCQKIMLRRGLWGWQNYIDHPRELSIFTLKELNGYTTLEPTVHKKEIADKVGKLHKLALFVARKAVEL